MKKTILVLAAFLFSIPAFSMLRFNANENIGIELSADIGCRTGIVREYVTNSIDDTKLSRLDWQIDAIPTLNFGAKADIYNVIFGGSFLTSIQMDCGKMEDYDWDLYPVGAAHNGILTNYSNHTLKLNNFIEANAFLGYNIKLPETKIGIFSIAPLASFFYRNFKFTGNDGYKKYAKDKWEEINLRGSVISYQQEILYFSAYLEVNWYLKKDFDFKIFGSYAPYVWCNSIDNHISKSTKYYDYMNGGYAFSVGGEFSWKFVALRVSYDFMKRNGGKTISKENGEMPKDETNDGDINYRTYPGTDQSFLTVSVKFKL